MSTWKLQDAKARFSELVERTLAQGPQIVTRHGENVVVVVPYRQFVEATGGGDFKAWLAAAPSANLYLSVVTVAEIRKGIVRLRRSDAAAAHAIEGWLARLLS